MSGQAALTLPRSLPRAMTRRRNRKRASSLVKAVSPFVLLVVLQQKVARLAYLGADPPSVGTTRGEDTLDRGPRRGRGCPAIDHGVVDGLEDGVAVTHLGHMGPGVGGVVIHAAEHPHPAVGSGPGHGGIRLLSAGLAHRE